MSTFFQELFHIGFYKRSQGRIARQATFFALLVIVALGAWRLHVWMDASPTITTATSAAGENGEPPQSEGFFGRSSSYWVPLAIFVVCGWISFRAVQMPAFADFLISVEAEMNKVSWPSRSELFRASLVVIVTIFFLAALLATYDYILILIPQTPRLLAEFWTWLVG